MPVAGLIKLHGRIIDHNIDSSEFSHGLFHDPPGKILISDVSGNRQASPAELLHPIPHFLGIAVFIVINNGEVRFFLGKSIVDRSFVPLSPPDDRYIADQLPGADKSGFSEIGLGIMLDSIPGCCG